MNPKELRSIMSEKGIRPYLLKKLLNVSSTSIQRWLNGVHPVPKSVELVVRGYDPKNNIILINFNLQDRGVEK